MYGLALMEKWFTDFFIFRCSSLTNPVKNNGDWFMTQTTIHYRRQTRRRRLGKRTDQIF